MVAASTGAAAGILVLVYLAVFVLVVVAWGRILGKAGYSPWLCLLAIVPFVNLVMFFIFAFGSWPIQRQQVTGYGPPPGASTAWGAPQPMTGYPPPGGYPTPPPGGYPPVAGSYPPTEQPPPPSGGMV